MTYCSTSDVWNNLGKDAFTKVQSEIVGTSSTTASSNYNLDHDNIIATSLTLYTNSATLTSSAYTLNLDDGTITGLTGAASGSVITADYRYADIPDSVISQIISSSDNLIELRTGRTFGQTTGATEYLNVDPEQKTFFLPNYPVITLSSVAININGQTDTPNWETCSSGLGNDYLASDEDLRLGRIRFIDNFPDRGEDMVKVIYNYGYSTTPATIKELSILISMREMGNSSIYKAIFKGQDNFTPVKLDELNVRIEELFRINTGKSMDLI